MQLTQKQAAELIGRSAGWLRSTDCPRLANGSYDSAAVAQWYVASQAMSLQELEDQKAELEVEVLEVRSAKMNQENRLEAGELMRMEDFRAAGTKIAQPIRKAGDLFARGVRFAGADAASVLRQACIASKKKH